jgi:succinyl-CoA synthetase beta subunit
VQPRFGRTQGDAQCRSDLGHRQVEIVVQDDESPLLGLELVEAALELVAVSRLGHAIGGRHEIQLGQLDVEAMSPEPSRFIDAGTDEQAMEPGVEAFRVAQRGQITPGSDECVLHGVLRLIGVPEDQPSGRVQTRDRVACQLGEGVMIALPRSLHEVSLHHALGGGAAHLAPLDEYGEAGVAVRSMFIRQSMWTRYHRAPAPPCPLEPTSPVKIQEADAKSLLVAQGLPVPAWEVAHTVDEARAAAGRFLDAGAGKVVIKAQVLVGGRGKAGGVKLAGSVDEAAQVADAILGMDIKGMTVHKVLIGAAADIVKEFYLAAVLDRADRGILLMGSAEGGVEIEVVAVDHPEAIIRRHADPLLGLLDYQARELAFAMGLGAHLKAAVAIAKGLVATMRAYDADLVEINPLAIVREIGPDGAAVERLVCLDAKVTLDDSALPRHAGLEALRDPDEEDPTDREAREAGLTFIKLDGTIGCMVNGAGLAMTTMDLVKRAGGEPANFLDIGGGARADKVTAAMRLILADPKVDAILVNIFGGITRGDEVARGLIEARAQQTRDVPMIVRIVGTNAAEAAVLLEQARFETAASLDDAAAKAVAASRGTPA